VTPRAGDLFQVGPDASVQFSRPIFFRVIRVHDWSTYNGWLWLDGYQVDNDGDAVERRSIFVQVAGLKPANMSRPLVRPMKRPCTSPPARARKAGRRGAASASSADARETGRRGRSPAALPTTPGREHHMSATRNMPDETAVGSRAAQILELIKADEAYGRLGDSSKKYVDCWATFTGYPK